MNAAVFSAGASAFLWYAFGALPLQLSVAAELGLDPARASSWISIVWISGAIASIAISLRYRQPIPITWTIPGLVLLGAVGGQFSAPEVAGACLAAGVALVALGIAGAGTQVMRWLPQPIVMGMFAGSIIGYVTRMVSATVEDFAVAGAVVAGYLVGRIVGSPRVPPVGIAALAGGAVVACLGIGQTPELQWSPPALAVPEMEFSASAVLALGVPLVVLVLGLGNVQGLGFLAAQGYRVPVNAVSVLAGIASVVNALFGGHPASVARAGVAMLASPETGPAERRYLAVVVSALLTLALAFAALPLALVLGALPKGYVVALAGVAILAALQDALERSFGGDMKFGALVALAVAATPFTVLGIGSAFWALLCGLAASAAAERAQLAAFWRAA
jgi:benzoate membrane transport protein